MTALGFRKARSNRPLNFCSSHNCGALGAIRTPPPTGTHIGAAFRLRYWVTAEMFVLIRGLRIYAPPLKATFVINRPVTPTRDSANGIGIKCSTVRHS